MTGLALIDAARLTSLATGRGGLPSVSEWPILAVLLVVFAFVGTRALASIGLTKVEAFLVAGVSPLLVLVDAPLGQVAPSVALAANATGCLIPAAIGVKVLLERRLPWIEALILLAVGIGVAYLASHVVPSRGVLLQYRVPAVAVGLLAAGLLYRMPERAGAAGFAAGGMGVVVGADLMRIPELASAGSGRIILGGAGLLDGILLVAVLAAAIGEGTAVILRAVVRVRTPAKQPV